MRRQFITLTALVLAGIGMATASADDVVKYTVNNYSIEAPLGGLKGDAAKGRSIVIHRKKGNCLSCHSIPIPEEADHGNVGPNLAGVASRMNQAQLRMRVVDPKQINPNTMMPAFHKTEGLHRVMKKYAGKPILTAQEVEHVVAYLTTLK
jgi:L-cysteine S-thiosulfotransferase